MPEYSRTLYKISIEDAQDADQDYSLRLYQRSRWGWKLVQTESISAERVRESRGSIEGSFDLADRRDILDGRVMFTLTGLDRTWYGTRKTLARSDIFNMIRLLDQPVRGIRNLVQGIDAYLGPTDSDSEDDFDSDMPETSLEITVFMQPLTSRQRNLFFHLVDASTGKRVLSVPYSASPTAAAAAAPATSHTDVPTTTRTDDIQDMTLTMNVPQTQGEFYVEASIRRGWFRSDLVLYRSIIFDLSRLPSNNLQQPGDPAIMDHAFANNNDIRDGVDSMRLGSLPVPQPGLAIDFESSRSSSSSGVREDEPDFRLLRAGDEGYSSDHDDENQPGDFEAYRNSDELVVPPPQNEQEFKHTRDRYIHALSVRGAGTDSPHDLDPTFSSRGSSSFASSRPIKFVRFNADKQVRTYDPETGVIKRTEFVKELL